LQQGQRWVNRICIIDGSKYGDFGMPVIFGDGISSADYPFDFRNRTSSEKLRTGKLENKWEQLSTKVKNLEKHRCLLMTPSLSIFDLRAKQDVWFRNTELNYNCRLFKLMTAGGNGGNRGRRFLLFPET
jgi:hypothetical protein